MARPGLTHRLEELERVRAPKFSGFASIDIWPGQTVDEAKAAWEAENGPVGNRRWLMWNFGGLDAAA